MINNRKNIDDDNDNNRKNIDDDNDNNCKNIDDDNDNKLIFSFSSPYKL